MALKIIETQTEFTSKFLNLNSTTYTDANGSMKKWYWAQRPNNTHAVLITAFLNVNNIDKLVVIKEFRVPLNDYEYSLPAGLIDEGEDPKVAAEREFHEETGLHITKFLNFGPLVYNSAGLSDEGVHIAFAEANGEVDNSKHEVSEDIQTLLLSREDVSKLITDSSYKISAKAYLIFLMFSAGV